MQRFRLERILTIHQLPLVVFDRCGITPLVFRKDFKHPLTAVSGIAQNKKAAGSAALDS
jgi:hypothetical protein